MSREHALLRMQSERGNAFVQRVVSAARDTSSEPTTSPEHRMLPPGVQSDHLRPFGTAPRSPAVDTVKRESIGRVRSASDSGTPLSDADRETMESSVHRDLGDVRIHADDAANELTDMVNARAATIGHDIYVQPEEYRPGTGDWHELLAHEVTHVVQTDGQEGLGSLVDSPSGQSEQEAARVAPQIARGEPVTASVGASNAIVQRVPRPFTDVIGLTFQSLDSQPIIDYARRAAGNVDVGNVLDNTGLTAQIRQICTPAYFRQGNTVWTSDEVKWDPGFWYPNVSCRVTVELLEDNAHQLAEGTAAQVGSTTGVSSTTGTSTGTQTSGSGGGTAGNKDTNSASASGGSQTTTTTSGGITSGGSATGSQASATQVWQSTLFARVTVNVRNWDMFTTYSTYQDSSTVRVGEARYTKPTLMAPSAAPATP